MLKTLLTAFVLLSALSHSAYALRCGNRLVAVDDHYSQVLRLCGEPLYVKEWIETRVFPATLDPLSDWQRYGRIESGKVYGSGYIERSVVIEEWTYNFGRHRFQRLLTFEDGVLKDIRSLSYGH